MRGTFPLLLWCSVALALALLAGDRIAVAAPALQLPWPSGQQHRISGGTTYGCDYHTTDPATSGTAYNADKYGIDFQFALDEHVSSTAFGTVIVRGFDNGYGNKVVVDHGGGYTSTYAHLNGFAVAQGATVSQGQVVGYAGNTGGPYPVHLHFHMMLGLSAYKAEPMSNVSGFGWYGFSVESGLGCGSNAHDPSPYWVSYPMGEAIGVSSWASNRLDVFVRGNDDAMYRKWWDGTGWYPTSTWEAHPGCLTDGPTAASWDANRIDVFVRGCDNLLYWKYWNGGPNWSGWQQFADGCLGSAPAVVSWGFGRLDLFVRGCGGELVWRNTADGGASWTGWQNLGGCLSAGPGAAVWTTK